MGRLQGKVAFITGAGSGIARVATRLFTQEGAKVVIAELKPELGQASEKEVRSAGGEATFIETDVTKEESVKNALQKTVERYGKLDVLYNCAGGSIVQDAKVTDVEMWVWEHTQSLDLLGTFLCCRHGIPELIRAGGGSIVNMSSVVALRGSFPAHIYAAAKGGIISLTRSLAGEYSQNGVRANAICPGPIETPLLMDWLLKEPAEKAKRLNRIPMGRFGKPLDVAHLALYLASDESAWTNGAAIVVDGGITSNYF